MNGSIALITFHVSIVVRSMEKGLKDLDYDVITLEDRIDDITAATERADVFILYLPDAIFDDMDRVKKVLLICETLRNNNRSIILIGAEQTRDDFVRTVPSFKYVPWISRPVDMNRLTEEIEREARRVESSRAQKRILIIDDDPFYARMVCEWLKDDYQMDMVTDGMKSISFLSNHKADLVLLDYEMPVLDGPKVLEMLRAYTETSTIPVIFLTGVGTKESIQRVMGLKPQGYVLKSATRMELLNTLRQFFEKRGY